MNQLREFKVNIGGSEYDIVSDDNYLEHAENGFEPEMLDLFRVLAENSKTVLDIGSNIGCTAIFFASIAKSVYAFEPSPSTFSLLEKNVSKSRKKNVHSKNYGIGYENGETNLTFAPSNRSGGFVSNKITASLGHTVERIAIKRLDDVIVSLGVRDIEFIKIDVEGFEGDVLRGAKQTLAKHKPVVVLELNHWCLNAFQRTSVPDFFDQLRSIFPVLLAVDGLSYMNLHDEGESYIVMYHHILQNRFQNIVAGFHDSNFERFRKVYNHDFC